MNNMKRMWFVKQAEVHLDLIENYFILGWNSPVELSSLLRGYNDNLAEAFK
jgi:hypothetical protein